MTSSVWPAPYTDRPVSARVELPASKSLTNRALVLAALADGPGVVSNALRSRDTELMAQALRGLGVQIDSGGPDWSVVPGLTPGDAEVDCGLAGTVMRFVPPVAALRAGRTFFDGDPHARTRPMAQILHALGDLGVEITGGPTLPFTVRGSGRARGGEVALDASASSQFVSALLLAAPRFDEGLTLRHTGPSIPSQPHLDMTVAGLRERGVTVHADGAHWRVEPGPIAALRTRIEPDLSNAAPFLMLALVSGGSVTVADWPQRTTQPGDALREILTAMGGEVSWSKDGLTVTATGSIRGLDIDLHDLGELTPAVAALAALADSPSHLYGVAHIRGHETDRLAALAHELGKVGAEVEELPDGLRITPAPLHAASWHSYADHRMAHAGVILGAGVPGIEVEDIATTAKTFPGFADAWSALF